MEFRTKIKEEHFLYGLLGAAAVFCAFIFWPFLAVIVLAAAFAVVLRRPYLWIEKHLPGPAKGAAAAITVFIFVVVLAIPLAFLGIRIADEARTLYGFLLSGGAAQMTTAAFVHIQEFLPGASLADAAGRFDVVAAFMANGLANVFTATLATVFDAVLIILALYYFLKDGDRWLGYAVEISPLSRGRNEKLIGVVARAVNGVFAGYILIAAIQGTLLGIGLWIFGVPNPALWGLLAAAASMIPTFGTALVSVPSVLYLLFADRMGSAIGLAVWAAVLVGTIDNFLTPIIVGKRIELPPLVVLFAVLGGASFLGVSGILIGPLAVSFLYALVRIYREDFSGRQES